MIWDDLLAALALVLVIEGIVPFLSPKMVRSAMQGIDRMSDGMLRRMGFVLMLFGCLLLYFVR
ncbi:DUF2065 domain-containing protein [Thioalkalivibrio sp. HK1]|uniref:DUF2065 domain-containing protein n=1 Tax=Thioalkalivibrio sp. HK1 TaxID=1469245 RepID=UPI0004B332FE|nr:DUF2065 domain-containing protein [Thioalkalivibrio sp. HK1]